jgi:phosphate transport system permease protein
MRGFRKFREKIVEGVLLSSSTITSITVLLIIVFLFREGIGLFSEKPMDKNFVIAVNRSNPLNQLSVIQIKDIFNQDVTNWKEVGGMDDSIIVFTINSISLFLNEDELGENFEYLPAKIDSLIAVTPGMIAFVSNQYKAKNFRGKEIPVDKITVSEFVTGKEWYPTTEPVASLGILPLILGTLWVSLGAIFLAVPFGLATAIFMAEVANRRIRNILKPVVELLASIPSVVYGFFGLVVLVPLIQQLFKLDVGETALAGSIILAIMALPTIISVSEDAMQTTPRSLKEASLALGANQWQTITRVIIPYSKSGITAGIILGIGRAIGETMAVLMVTGNAGVIPHTFLQPVRTIPATIAAELGEAPFGGLHYKALFALAIVLFIITFAVNLTVEFIKKREPKNA